MENPSYYYSEDYDRIFQAKYIEVQKAILNQSKCYKLGILISTIKYGNSTELEHGIDRVGPNINLSIINFLLKSYGESRVLETVLHFLVSDEELLEEAT
uniref:Uncharacterized protein n=1 Tax=Vespula pensylvanica TaxID=30213 RepID=A0A834UGX7_VESPE|nr:hypothetical protein H0235_001024 [Vespula pensylvanica]